MAGFTETFRSVPAWIGNDFVLDAAAKYTVDCHQAFMRQDETALNSAKKSGAEAMRALRFALAQSSIDATDPMLMSMYAMIMSEASLPFVQQDGDATDENYNYKLHELALCQILKQRWTSGRWGILEQRLLRSIHSEEALESAITGTVSDLDDPLRISAARAISSTDTHTNQLFDSIMDQTIRLPRLSALHRQLRLEGPEDPDLVTQITSLAKTLWAFTQAPQIESVIDSHSSTSPSPDDTTCPLQALDFTSIRIYILATRHHMNRIILALNLLKLLALHPFPFPYSEIRTTLLHSAEFISRCIPYAIHSSSSSSGPPWNALRIFAPLTLAYGAWVFLEGEEEGDDHVRAMREFTAWGFRKMAESWRWNAGLGLLLGYTEAWTGGETMEWMAKKRG
ncbi:hypothetical protein PRZ48_012929 [Zasmidium cellare]|uniref:Uncharacterized protein n=1 Tax=Zasmidium cellare TaxID=395010 RepID=A0ABR0E2L5_ZASCE|nr:hypothetical protein PRZ48_012929 [Zasmidium cellare]